MRGIEVIVYELININRKRKKEKDLKLERENWEEIESKRIRRNKLLR
jgi:hypothetical protein